MSRYKPYSQAEAQRLASFLQSTIDGSRIVETAEGYDICTDDSREGHDQRVHHTVSYQHEGDNPHPEHCDQQLRTLRATYALHVALRDAGVNLTDLSKQLFGDRNTLHVLLHAQHPPVTADQLILIADAAGLEMKFEKK